MIKNHTAIILINWNSWKDTRECLASLRAHGLSGCTVILVDNGSDDDSVEECTAWASSSNRKEGFGPFGSCYETQPMVTLRLPAGSVDQVEPADEQPDLVLIESSENLGFARGTNIGISFALKHSFKYILLLNNDTTVPDGAVKKLVDFADMHPEFSAITPQIRYYDKPDLIWNCGGRLTSLGGRKYYYAGESYGNVRETYFPVSFVTGCAMLIKASFFRKHGLLSSRFFFGEEDYELCLRLRQLGKSMACFNDSFIYHKVGGTEKNVFTKNSLPSFFNYVLNRMINLRYFYPLWYWYIWRLPVFALVTVYLVFKRREAFADSIRFLSCLNRYSLDWTGITKKDFFGFRDLFLQKKVGRNEKL